MLLTELKEIDNDEELAFTLKMITEGPDGTMLGER